MSSTASIGSIPQFIRAAAARTGARPTPDIQWIANVVPGGRVERKERKAFMISVGGVDPECRVAVSISWVW